LGALAFSSSALAAYAPRFVVTHSPHNVSSASTTITISQTRNDEATAKVTFYVPQGYTGILGQTPGAQLGTVRATVQATQISQDAILPINGTVVAASGADPTIAAASQQCTGTTTHAAFWVLALEASGQRLQVPVFIDTLTGPEAAFAQFRLQVCLPPPATATFGAKLLTAALTLSNVFAAPTAQGQFVWPAIFTPYASNAGPINPAGTVQSRAVVRLPGQMTLAGRVANRRQRLITITGRVSENLTPVAGARVELLIGNRVAFRTTTRANGTYRFSLRKRGRASTTTFRGRVIVPQRSVTAAGCAIQIPNLPAAPGGCVTATAGAWRANARGSFRVRL
jgi:hypothetical protein